MILENKLTESCKPGDDIMITGVLEHRWKFMPPAEGQRSIVELILIANNVEVLNKREFQHGNLITVESLNDFKRYWKRYDQF